MTKGLFNQCGEEILNSICESYGEYPRRIEEVSRFTMTPDLEFSIKIDGLDDNDIIDFVMHTKDDRSIVCGGISTESIFNILQENVDNIVEKSIKKLDYASDVLTVLTKYVNDTGTHPSTHEQWDSFFLWAREANKKRLVYQINKRPGSLTWEDLGALVIASREHPGLISEMPKQITISL